jgi:hypothetical protein
MGIDRNLDGILDGDTGTVPPPAVVSMHIGDLLTTDSGGNPKTTFVRGDKVFWRALVVDQNNSRVSGASVRVDLVAPNNTTTRFTGTTQTDGWALFSTTTKKNTARGVYTIRINSVAKSNATYDASANVKSSTTYTIQ